MIMTMHTACTICTTVKRIHSVLTLLLDAQDMHTQYTSFKWQVRATVEQKQNSTEESPQRSIAQ